MLDEESWQPIAAYVGLYEVSSHGRVKSLDREVGAGLRRWIARGRLLANRPHAGGYVSVQLCRDGKARSHLVHRLVAEAFCGSGGSGQEVNHLDGDKQNNRAANLRWCSRADNIAHAVACGLIDNRGEKNAAAKLTPEAVKLIRSSSRSGASLAREFGVSAGAVYAVRQGKRW